MRSRDRVKVRCEYNGSEDRFLRRDSALWIKGPALNPSILLEAGTVPEALDHNEVMAMPIEDIEWCIKWWKVTPLHTWPTAFHLTVITLSYTYLGLDSNTNISSNEDDCSIRHRRSEVRTTSEPPCPEESHNRGLFGIYFPSVRLARAMWIVKCGVWR